MKFNPSKIQINCKEKEFTKLIVYIHGLLESMSITHKLHSSLTYIINLLVLDNRKMSFIVIFQSRISWIIISDVLLMLREIEIDVFFNFLWKLSLNHVQYRQMKVHQGLWRFMVFLLNISKFSFMISAFKVVFVGGYSKYSRLFKYLGSFILDLCGFHLYS